MPTSATPAPVGEAARPRKRRPWLLMPAVGMAVFLAACSGGWLYARWRIDGALDAQVAALNAAGWRAAMGPGRWSGFPFRLRLQAADVKLVAPSGWGVEAPQVEAQAMIFDPAHWVYAAPQGLVLDRGAAGPLQVRGTSLSASTAGMAGPVWRVAVVGEGLALSPGAGAKPTAFTRIARWEAYLRPAADRSGDAEALWRITGAQPTPGGLVWRFSPDAPVEATLSGRFTRPAALGGVDGGGGVRAWAQAGGGFQLQTGEAQGGPTRLQAQPARMSVGADGRLQGVVPLRIEQRADAAGPRGEAHGATQLVFADGATRLGGLRLGPSPEVAR